jgi:single-strand DNA-binding protein
MIKLTLIGNLGKEASVISAGSRKAIVFDIAENETWKDREGVKHSKTTWISCQIWKNEGESMELAKYLKKGTQVYIEGKPEVNTYTTKEGNFAANIRMNVSKVELLSAPQQATAPQAAPTQTQATPEPQYSNSLPDPF